MKVPEYKILSVVGNRPQFVKQAMFDAALARQGNCGRLRCLTVNTGQHYDEIMSDVFFSDLKATPPSYDLGVGSGPVLDQVGKMLTPLREVVERERPDGVLLFGDTNSTLAGAIAAAHSGIPSIHVEGGERLYKRYEVPEEVNRVVADHLSSLVLTSSRKAGDYLCREGFSEQRAVYVGDIMLDLFKTQVAKVDERAAIAPSTYGVHSGHFILATIHRVENTSSVDLLLSMLDRLDNAPMPVVLPAHPRVAAIIENSRWKPKRNLKLIGPLGYFDFLALLRDAALIVSDSGGVTREALFAGKGCIVPLSHCWWTEAVNAGLAVTVGRDGAALTDALETFRPPSKRAADVVEREFGDGQAAFRIGDQIVRFLDARRDGGQLEGAWHRLGCFEDLPIETVRQDFTYASYRELLSHLKEYGYRFTRFKLPTEEQGAVCLLRHDIDFDLDAALKIARVEAEEDVTATYFLMLTSDHYNVFSRKSRAKIQEIIQLGHRIGLHFDETCYPELRSHSDYSKLIKKESNLLARAAYAPIDAVSLHRPSALVLEGDPALSAPLLHSYDRRLRSAADYVSDSGGRWGHGHPLGRDAYKARRPLHILVHPIWWHEDPKSAFESLMGLLDARRHRDEESFAENCRPFRVGRLSHKYNHKR